MKRTKILMGVVLATASITLFSCASKPQPQETSNEKPVTTVAKKQKHVERELIDWKGASIGQDIPEWVSLVVDGETEGLDKSIKGLDGKEIFLAEGTGKNLDILKSWTNNFDVQGSFSRSIKNRVIASFGGVLEGSKNKAQDESYMEELVGSFSKAKISGLVKKTDYWVQTRIIDNDSKKTEDVYQYFVVYAIDKEDYRALIDEALGKVAARNEREQELKNETRNIALAAAVLDMTEDQEAKEASQDDAEILHAQ